MAINADMTLDAKDVAYPEPTNVAPEAEPTAEITEDQVARDLIDYYSDAIGSLVGSEGAWYMASPVDLNQEEIASWWTNLTPDAQRAVAGLMSDVAALPDGDSSKQYGHSLRQWLEVNSLLNAN